jgi:hypothetical protein
MVYDKKRSGDPDYDDKQPISQQAGKIVQGPDGRDVLITDVTGPVDRVTGEHVNLDVRPGDLDNRPAPGEVATEASSVQTYSVEDTPIKDGDHVHGETPAALGTSGTPDQPDVEQAKATDTGTAKSARSSRTTGK